MMKELEKVMIEDVEYSYDPEKEYIKRWTRPLQSLPRKKRRKSDGVFWKQDAL